MFTDILLASDGSSCALRAAAVAASLADSFGARLTLVSVLEPFPSIDSYEDTVAIDHVATEVLAAQEEAVANTGRVVAAKNVSYQSRREVGHPAVEIVRVAEERGCDLIVIGGRGLSAVPSFLLGSVADRVAHHAHCPVLIVK